MDSISYNQLVGMYNRLSSSDNLIFILYLFLLLLSIFFSCIGLYKLTVITPMTVEAITNFSG